MFHEFGFHTLLTALRENGVPFTVVKIVPFSHELTWFDGGSIPEADVPTMVWGMTCVEQLSEKKGWKPGVFKNENFDMRVLLENYGHFMLNSDGKFYEMGQVPEFEGARFIRPVHDTKSFTGDVINGDEFKVWQQQLYDLKGEFTTLDTTTPVMVASPKKLGTECRFFIVDGKVVSGSTYRVDGRPLRKRVDMNYPLAMPLREFAESMVRTWNPCQAFVMDVARVVGSDDFKIVEINCLNSSGFYDTDMAAVVRAIEHRRERWVYEPKSAFVRV